MRNLCVGGKCDFLNLVRFVFLGGLVMCLVCLIIFLGGVLLMYKVFDEWFIFFGVKDLVL